MIAIGFNARLFPNNWRPILQEIAFAAAHGFQSMQIIVQAGGITADLLGAEVEQVGAALHTAKLMPVMEINLALRSDGLTAAGLSPLEVLRANLPAIQVLGITAVHWHFTLVDRELPAAEVRQLEKSLIPILQQGVELAAQRHFRLGIEHNSPDLHLFGHPDDCAATLEAVAGLGFVWDFNHTHPDHMQGFKALAPRLSLLHVSDTPLPDTNYHLPLGQGNVNFRDYCQTAENAGYRGAAILEVGGLPKSGGYGRDTDEVLLDSQLRLASACELSR